MKRYAPRSHLTVLVVDDDPHFRSILAEVLAAERCRVAHAPDGAAALDVLRSLTPDLIVVDLAMPKVSGWELVRRLERDRRLSTVPLVVLSALPYETTNPRCRVLEKPVDLQNLLGLLSAVDAARSESA